MEISWLKYSPTENITALVTTHAPEYQRPQISAAIMHADPEVERVGFITPAKWPESTVRVDMAGGEFCAAGVICAAAYAGSRWMNPGTSTLFPVEAADVADFMPCMLHMESGHCDITVEMPMPVHVETALLSYAGKSYQMPVVRYAGVTYAILPADGMDHSAAEDAVREWCRIEKAEAMGLVFYNAVTSYIEPLVYVPASNTLCWERGSADGSAALGAFLTSLAKATLLSDVRQPGGTVKVRGDWSGGKLSRVAVSTRVEFIGAFTTVV